MIAENFLEPEHLWSIDIGKPLTI